MSVDRGTPVELRSDTFTLPTPEMADAMRDAELGDDVYGEDPTVAELEALAAATVGKQAAVVMPSGTMANLTALLTHVPRGESALVGDESDIYLYEARGASVLGGIAYQPVPTQPDGTLTLADLDGAFPEEDEDPQFVLPRLICLENTHNRCGGVALPLEYLAAVRRFADDRGLALHLDGARIFNAALSLGVDPAEICGHADSVQFCLSKGLGAPIGSILAGDSGFIEQARRWRKMLGGGMRQAGILAAPGIIALKDYRRLAEDHDNARLLADELARVPGVELETSPPQSNILLFRVAPELFTPAEFTQAARALGIGLGEFGHGRVRAVVHRGVTSSDILNAARTIGGLLDSRRPPKADA